MSKDNGWTFIADQCSHKWIDPHDYTPFDFIGDMLSCGAHSENRRQFCAKCGEDKPSTRGML